MSVALVTGATGNVGREVVAAARAARHRVRAVSRTPDRTFGAGVETLVGDLERPATLYAAAENVDAIFLIPGYEGARELLAHARRHGRPKVVLLSGGSAGTGDATNAITRFMMRSEADVRASDLPWTIIRPNAFMSNALRWRAQLRTGDQLRLPFAELRTALVHPADLGAVAVAAFSAHDGEILTPSGPEALTVADQVAILGAGLHRALSLEPQPDDEARAEMLGQMPEEYVDAIFDFYRGGAIDESVVTRTVRDVIGRESRPFRDWVTAHVADFA